jgi:1-aminocyclopropane-1-carboxylate deaminase/D-cysteine desulfhydrase-like pyridoxal-dependent ACC family enzyme
MLGTLIRRLQQQVGGKTHAAVAVNIARPNTHTQVVSVVRSKDKQAKEADELTPEELEQQRGEPLPERTQMSLIQTGPPTIGPIFDQPVQPPEEV